MKMLKAIMFFLCLTPMLGYGQKYNLISQDFSIKIEKCSDSIAKKIFRLAMEEKIVAYKTVEMDTVLEKSELNIFVEDYKVTKTYKDLDYPNDPFATIDSTIITPFSMNYIYGFSFIKEYESSLMNPKEISQLKAVSPSKYMEGFEVSLPTFWVKMESLKSVLTENEIKILNFIGHLSTTNLPRDSSGPSINLSKLYFDDNQMEYGSYNGFYKTGYEKEVFNILEYSFKDYYNLNSKSNKFTGFYSDSFLKVPLEKITIDTTFTHLDTCEHWLSMGVKDLNLFNDFIISFKNGFMKIESFENSNLSGCDYLIEPNRNVFHTMYCKQEDFLPHLPEWLRYLMKEVYIEK